MHFARTILTLAVLVIAGVAHADPDPATLEQAHSHYKQGKAFLDAKVYDKAIDEFAAAYKLSPFPELVFNIAQAYRLGHQADKAIAAYQEYLNATPSGELADEARAHVVELTVQAEQERQRAAAAATATQDQDNRARQQAAYDQDRQVREAHAHNRRVGYWTLGISGVATVAGIVIFAHDPSTPSATLGVGLMIAGLIGVLVGGATVAVSSDSGTPVATPAPLKPGTAPQALALGWTWQF